MSVITVSNLSKKFYIIPRKRAILKLACALTRAASPEYTLYALKDISFEIKRGEKVGIIGLNGAGKTTLLRVLSGIYLPDSGSVGIDGVFSAFFKMNLGAMPDLSVKDNIFLIGMVMGMHRKEIVEKLKAILVFAELEKFSALPFKDLSSGMKERVFFSMMLVNDAGILFLDEIITVGDIKFQDKSQRAFHKIFNSDKTILINTHDLDFMRRFCTRTIWLHDGQVVAIDKTENVVDRYKKQLTAL